MDYQKMVEWVNNNKMEVIPLDYGYWIVMSARWRANIKLVVKASDNCRSWLEAVNLAMIRS